MNISVIIPAYNEEKYIAATLKSVIENAPHNLLEIIVVNNSSTDKTVEVIRAFPEIKLINEPEKGLTRARQAGLNAASGEILAYIDSDTLVRKQWFEVLNREFENNNELLCLSGPYHYYGLPEFKHVFSKLWYNSWYKIWYGFADFFITYTKGYVVTGGNFAAKKQALIDMGGFDTKIEFYGEDTDIARRLNKMGEIKFLKEFWLDTSARRFNKEGLISTAIIYLANYASVIFLKKPVTKKYNDVR